MLQVEHRTREYFGEQALTAHAGAQRFMRGYGGGPSAIEAESFSPLSILGRVRSDSDSADHS